MDKVNLIGAGGHSKVIQESNFDIQIISISDDNHENDKSLHKISLKYEDSTIIAIGDNSVRKDISKKVQCDNWITIIHTSSLIGNNVEIGKGTVIMPGVIIQPGVKIGDHCIINSGSVIEHDCFIDDYAHIAPNSSLAGGVKVGEGSLIGIGSSIIPNLEIGSWTTIGAGSVVINDIPANSTAFGNPCRVKEHHEKK